VFILTLTKWQAVQLLIFFSKIQTRNKFEKNEEALFFSTHFHKMEADFKVPILKITNVIYKNP